MSAGYQIKIAGVIGPAARDALSHLTVGVNTSTTLISGAMDADGLHDTLERIRVFGLELIEIHHLPDV